MSQTHATFVGLLPPLAYEVDEFAEGDIGAYYHPEGACGPPYAI